MTTIQWTVPAGLVGTSNYDKIRIFRSSQEQTGYVQIAEIASGAPTFVLSYDDVSADNGRDKYYLMKYYDSTALQETKYYLCIFELTPREMRLVAMLRNMLGSIVTTDPVTLQQLTDEELSAGITLGIQYFNVYPPITSFTIDNFPKDYEVLLLYGAQIMTLLNKYIGLAITDFNYNDNGLSLNLDRGQKVNQAIQQSTAWYNQLVTLGKLEFAYTGEGLGTLQLPVSVGGNIARGVSNLLDIFQSAGR